MNTIFILISLWAVSPDSVQTQYIQKFSTVTACERTAQSLIQGAEVGEHGQEKVFKCVPYKR